MRLHHDVRKLVDSGKLHEFDAEWISRLAIESQMAAAEKCMRNFGMRAPPEDNPKSCIYVASIRIGLRW